MSEVHNVAATFSNLTNSINKFGYNLPKFELENHEHCESIRSTPINQLFQIRASLESYNDIINEGPIPGESEKSQSERHFRKFLDKFSLSINENMLNDLQDDYLIEVYSKSHQQLYRSLNFLKLCSYDLGTLTFVPWDKLFYRPKENTDEMFKTINYVLDNNLENFNSNIPVHFLTELCSNRKFGYKLIRVGIIYDRETSESMGYVSIIYIKEVLDTFRVLH
jgi:hypothetical protein